MEQLFKVRPLNLYGDVADLLMLPMMHVLMLVMVGHWKVESPQQTHRWNNVKFRRSDVQVPPEYRLMIRGAPQSARAPSLWRHVPVTGWKEYVVLAPKEVDVDTWHVGWMDKTQVGLSRIPIKGAVRMLRGPDNVEFFGVDLESGIGLPLFVVGYGRLGDRSPYSDLPLL